MNITHNNPIQLINDQTTMVSKSIEILKTISNCRKRSLVLQKKGQAYLIVMQNIGKEIL